ncbi:PREDICTED: interleukin-31 [Galeopterus variegatus]|uniref:Interleukin-31 n=1 Tax=Galeopterus variegatus TaxID=482537 RepID=A0ABM0R4Z6_GALVR|nr:PREDICTED: interleukin-31 [Galeopterus variegatus]
MGSHAGPTSALFLLCCMGTWLSSHLSPIPPLQPSEVQKIIVELQSLSKQLLDDYVKKEKGVPTSQSYTLPCLTPDPQPPNNINSSAIQAHFKTIRQLADDNSVINEIIEQLDKLEAQDAPATNVSVPTDTLERKRFILTTLQQFSECMNLVLKSLNYGTQ